MAPRSSVLVRQGRRSENRAAAIRVSNTSASWRRSVTGIPGEVRLRLRAALWQAADEMGWLGLKSSDRTKHYERWTRDPDVGGVLAHYMNQGKIRVYIKDSLLKGYGVQRVSDRSPILMSLNISMEVEILHSYSKPHGLLLRDQRLICWGRADDWKIVLM